MQGEISRQLASAVKEEPPAVARYVFSVGATAAALFLTAHLSSALEGTYPFLALTAVMMSSLYGGLGPALVASLISIAALSPLAHAHVGGEWRAGDVYRLCLFSIVSFFVSIVGSSVRSARRQAKAGRGGAEDAAGHRVAGEGERVRLVGELTEALRARDEFLSIASHELKTPLTALQLQVQSLLRSLRRERADNPSAERVAGKLATVERQVGRLTGLINILLDVSNIMAGRLRMRLEQVDLAEVTRDIVAHLREPVSDAGSTIELTADAPVIGLWDKHRVEGIVTNLLSNAIKYGCGKPIHVSVQATGNSARIEVRDQGIGIAASDHARIFERFERAVPEQYGGMGMGLWIVRQTAEALGGTVMVKSNIGEGATFTVELPQLPATPPDRGELPPIS
jgi:signal transduction histidine kinase